MCFSLCKLSADDFGVSSCSKLERGSLVAKTERSTGELGMQLKNRDSLQPTDSMLRLRIGHRHRVVPARSCLLLAARSRTTTRAGRWQLL